MFTDAIRKAGTFTRPVRFISRNYASNIIVPGAATLFYINENGCALTCRHVAEEIIRAESINKNYAEFRKEISALKKGGNFNAEKKFAERRHSLSPDRAAQLKVSFDGVPRLQKFTISMSEKYDLALIRFECDPPLQTNYAVLLKDASLIQPGRMLCRLGYPFPEFSNFGYDEQHDDIIWTKEGNAGTPQFPIEGMITRHIGDKDGRISGIEMSTPGLRGQSGGPLFDRSGIVYGMQSRTHHLHLGFDMKKEKLVLNGREEIINNQPFLHVGQCVHIEIIREFLDQQKVKYYIGNSYEEKEAVNDTAKI